MGTTESIPLDEEPAPSPVNHPQVARPRPPPGSRSQQNQSQNPAKAKPVRKIDGLVLGGPQTGKRTLLQRLQGKDPFQNPPQEISTPPSITIPYRTPKSRALPDRILLTVRQQQQQQSTSDSSAKTDFIVLLVRPPWDECISVETLQLLERYLQRLGYRSNPEERSEDIQSPIMLPVCICILFNFRDVSADSSAEDWNPVLAPLNDLLHQYKVPKEKTFIQPISTSLRNCYGLDMLHGFIYRTYLFHKQTTLEKQMHWVASQLQHTSTPDVVSYAEFQKNAGVIVETPPSKPQRKIRQGTEQTPKIAEQQDESEPSTSNEQDEDRDMAPRSSDRGASQTSNDTRPAPGKPSRILPAPPSTAKPIRIGREALEAFLASDSDSDDEGESRPSTTAESSDDDDEDFFYDEKGRFRHETETKARGAVNRQGSSGSSKSSRSSSPSTEGVSTKQEPKESKQVTKPQDHSQAKEKPQSRSHTNEDTADKRKTAFLSRKRVSFADQQDVSQVMQEEGVSTKAVEQEAETAKVKVTEAVSDEGSEPRTSKDPPHADPTNGAGDGDEGEDGNDEDDSAPSPNADVKSASTKADTLLDEAHCASPQVQPPSKDDAAVTTEDSDDDDDEFVIHQQHDGKDDEDDDDEFVIQAEPSQESSQASEEKDVEKEFVIQEQEQPQPEEEEHEPPATPESNQDDGNEPVVQQIAESSPVPSPTKEVATNKGPIVAASTDNDDGDAFVIRQDPIEDDDEDEPDTKQIDAQPSAIEDDAGEDDNDDDEFVIQNTTHQDDPSEHEDEDDINKEVPVQALSPSTPTTTTTPTATTTATPTATPTAAATPAAAPSSSGLSSAAMAAILAAQQEAEAMLQQAQSHQEGGTGIASMSASMSASIEEEERQRERERKERKKEKKEKKKKDGKKKKKKKDKKDDDDASL